MTIQTDRSPPILYDIDYYLWLETTIEQLRSGHFSALDLENLIEELESMGRNDLRTANSLIKQIIIHRLKLDHSNSHIGEIHLSFPRKRESTETFVSCTSPIGETLYLPDIDPRKHWGKEINNFQEQLEDVLSQSLKAKIDLAKIYQRAKREILMDYTLELPQTCPYPLDNLLYFNPA